MNYKFFEVKNSNASQVDIPTLVYIECVLMPNGELINNGKTIKYIDFKDKILIAT
jgi:hypothetical protein